MVMRAGSSWVEEVSDGWDSRKYQRAHIARVLETVGAGLPESDLALLRAIYVDGRTIAETARLGGIPSPRLRLRVRRLVRRVLSREFAYVLEGRRRWSTTRRAVAEACFLQGRSTREAATFLRLSPYVVRRQREAILALCEGAAS